MILEQSSRFEEEFDIIIDFIVIDSINRALEFYDELILKIKKSHILLTHTEKEIIQKIQQQENLSLKVTLYLLK